MDSTTVIAVDVLGGDNAPEVVLQGVFAALNEDRELNIILCGPQDVVDAAAAKNPRCVAQVTTEVIAMDEHPSTAVRKKKDSSLVVGCQMVKEGRASGFFSAGSTGACLVAATLTIGRIKGVARPMLATIIPTPARPVLLCDVGANADCRPEYLVQFAKMAAIYMREVMGVASPRIGLLNIGEEETKGSEFAKNVYPLLKQYVPEFAGNAEGRDIMAGTFDAIVTDGFTGNVCLKTIEGTAKTLFSAIKQTIMASFASKLGALTMKKGFAELKHTFSADTYGGAPLIGVNGACVIGHGSSNATAVKNGILTTARIARARTVDVIARAVSTEAPSVEEGM